VHCCVSALVLWWTQLNWDLTTSGSLWYIVILGLRFQSQFVIGKDRLLYAVWMFNTTYYLSSSGSFHLYSLCLLSIHMMTTVWKKYCYFVFFIVNGVCMKYIIIIHMTVWISVNILRGKIIKMCKLLVLILKAVCDFLWLISVVRWVI
jgi:hypothetical protein